MIHVTIWVLHPIGYVGVDPNRVGRRAVTRQWLGAYGKSIQSKPAQSGL
jgi:hypothetical protein